ncbi:uncharacterized protein K02A2.6-like [Armigeres subalbatus]|uniref:uncharacterized protein K02A2.6-like n=1 Tax=Armigeres subalbatus TaxID=124917 RepID=UPI002ED4A0B7
MSCEFLIDSGAQVNTLTEESFKILHGTQKYRDGVYNIQERSDRPLEGYGSAGEINVMYTFGAFLTVSEDRTILLEKFYVVRECRSLLGRQTATRYSILLLGLQVPVESSRFGLQHMKREIAMVETIESFPKFNIPPIEISYDKTRPACRNIYMNIPPAVKPLVEQRLQHLLSSNIIEKVTEDMNTSFCSSMLVVPKGRNDIRLVIDLRGPNRYINRTPFSMPTLEKILVNLNGSKWFSTIDLTNAFFHIELHENSRHLTNFCTEFGMFRYVRLPFGLCNAPDIFQEVMQRKILAGCKGVDNYLDDMIVHGATKEEHDANLAAVLARLEEHNVKINTSKCVFASQSVKFIGFMLTPDGWEVEEEKLSAIRNFRRPDTCSEVKSFLGLITYIDRFILDRATKTEKLRALANAEVFYWTAEEEHEFSNLQNGAVNVIKKLGYFSTTDRTELFVDASGIGLGAVLIQFNDNDIPRIIACASKALTSTERKYPQTQKEALAVVWGVERFKFYLTGISFVIRSDAEANEFIFQSDHRIGKRAVSRAEAWALRLQPYDFVIKRVPGLQNIADVLSRLIKASHEAIPFEDDNEGHYLFTLDAGCMDITLGDIEVHSENDEELKGVRKALKFGKWPRELRRFEAQSKTLHYLGSLIYNGDKIVLPGSLRIQALESSHSGHIGEVSMKRIMREFFWWPGMATETEQFVKNCSTCCQLARKNPPIPLSSRELPENPWEIIQIDFLEIPGCGSGEFLVLVDIYSRFLTVVEMRRTNADCTNAALCEIFKRWGVPRIIQSDNGPPFQSSTFCTFWEEKGVKQRKAKTDPIFSAERYTVVARQGAKVVVVSQNGIQYARNIQDIKRAPSMELENDESLVLGGHDESSTIPADNHSSAPVQTEPGNLQPPGTSLRSRASLRKPPRYNSDYVYTVFQ